jgi:probable F420-dependent oxidoreductase
MKVRIGVSVGVGATTDVGVLGQLVDDLDELDFDSLWLPEVLTAPALDPLVALAFAAAHNPRLKLGTTMLLPGRNPVRLAKELATLDMLSGGRLLVTFVPGLPRSPEAEAVGVPKGEKGMLMDEVMPLLRRLWSGEQVSHHGDAANFDDVVVSPQPAQQPLEFWTGGMVGAALRRCGRFADGWLPSACTPDEAAEHFGVSIGYSHAPLSASALQAFSGGRRGVDPEQVVPVGLDALRDHLERFIDVGFSKFVVRPILPTSSWRSELESLADGVGDLQN